MGKRLCLFLAVLFVSVGIAFAQTQVNGIVISSEDGEPVVGAIGGCGGNKDGNRDRCRWKIQPQCAYRQQDYSELHRYAIADCCGKSQHEDNDEG